MKTFVKIPFLICAVLFTVSTGCKKSNDNNTAPDPWAGLRDLGPGEVKFNGDKFCFYDCSSDRIFCGERAFMDCDISKYHPDYFKYNYYFVTVFPDSISNVSVHSYKNKVFGYTATIAFCGLSGNTYSGTWFNNYIVNSCSDIYDKSPKGSWDGVCADECHPCVPNCSGRDCGPDGCGGICGTCGPTKTCSIGGTCTGGSTGDPCTACLNTCQGIEGCCTGCGCICETSCGGCFK